MGKADKMQVVPGDAPLELGSVLFPFTFTSSVSFLLPFLLLAQCFQLYNGYTLLQMGFTSRNPVEWQVYSCGVLFCALGIGNMSTTLFTVGRKIKIKEK